MGILASITVDTKVVKRMVIVSQFSTKAIVSDSPTKG
jgi:hypothetical protein